MLKLNMFGSLSLSYYESLKTSSIEREKIHLGGVTGSLLAYLAIGRGTYYSRNELVATLWADRAETLGTGKLNTALWRLRKLIERPPMKSGDLIACDRWGAIGLHPDAQVELDVEIFVNLVAPVLRKSLEHTTEKDIDALRNGIKLYSADILIDLADEWALREREKYRRHYLNALGRMMNISALRQEWEDGIRYGQAILDIDALREDVHRDLMRMFVQGGQRAMALRQFEICRSALKRELAIQPMNETMNIYQNIAGEAIRSTTEQVRGRSLATHERNIGDLPEFTFSSTLPGTLHNITTDNDQLNNQPMSSPAKLIETARHHLAEADACLQLSLPLVTDSHAG